jgi:hypothetical protein
MFYRTFVLLCSLSVQILGTSERIFSHHQSLVQWVAITALVAFIINEKSPGFELGFILYDYSYPLSKHLWPYVLVETFLPWIKFLF